MSSSSYSGTKGDVGRGEQTAQAVLYFHMQKRFTLIICCGMCSHVAVVSEARANFYHVRRASPAIRSIFRVKDGVADLNPTLESGTAQSMLKKFGSAIFAAAMNGLRPGNVSIGAFLNSIRLCSLRQLREINSHLDIQKAKTVCSMRIAACC